MNNSLSVVVTIYNLESYVSKCINSILEQTYLVDEIIIVNDGSTDNSKRICEEYENNHNIIRLIHTDRVGTAAARMEGTRCATGEYIAFIDGDDWIESSMYENYMEQVTKYKPDVVIGEIIKEYGDDSRVIKNRVNYGIYEGKNYSDLIDQMFDCGSFSDKGIHASLCSKIFKREKIENFIYKVDKRIVYGEDAAVLYPFLLTCEKAVVTDLCGYHWVMRENSKTHSHDKNYLEELNYLENYLRDYIPKEKFLPFMVNQIQNALHREYDFCSKYEIREKSENKIGPQFLFPFDLVNRDENILIYGNGVVGKVFCQQLKIGYCNVVGVVDMKCFNNEYYNVIKPEEISDYKYDKVVIAVEKGIVANEIRAVLEQKGVEKNRIIWKEYRLK